MSLSIQWGCPIVSRLPSRNLIGRTRVSPSPEERGLQATVLSGPSQYWLKNQIRGSCIINTHWPNNIDGNWKMSSTSVYIVQLIVHWHHCPGWYSPIPRDSLCSVVPSLTLDFSCHHTNSCGCFIRQGQGTRSLAKTCSEQMHSLHSFLSLLVHLNVVTGLM